MDDFAPYPSVLVSVLWLAIVTVSGWAVWLAPLVIGALAVVFIVLRLTLRVYLGEIYEGDGYSHEYRSRYLFGPTALGFSVMTGLSLLIYLFW